MSKRIGRELALSLHLRLSLPYPPRLLSYIPASTLPLLLTLSVLQAT